MNKIIKAVFCFGLFFLMSTELAMAVLPPVGIDKVVDQKIETVPIVVTPTKSYIMPIKDIDIDIMPLATKTPTPIVVTQVVTATPEPIKPTVTVAQTKPTETQETTVTPEPVETVVVEPTIEEVEKTEVIAEKSSSNNLFWGVVVGVLVLILAVQIWSTKKNEKKQSKKENQ